MTDAMKTLGQFAITDIRESMNGLTNKAASTEAARLAELHNVTVNTIYNLTQDLRPKRKTRADKGKRAATKKKSSASFLPVGTLRSKPLTAPAA